MLESTSNSVTQGSHLPERRGDKSTSADPTSSVAAAVWPVRARLLGCLLLLAGTPCLYRVTCRGCSSRACAKESSAVTYTGAKLVVLPSKVCTTRGLLLLGGSCTGGVHHQGMPQGLISCHLHAWPSSQAMQHAIKRCLLAWVHRKEHGARVSYSACQGAADFLAHAAFFASKS